jgi:glycosyltransferase involved in cell wall biosynthesis
VPTRNRKELLLGLLDNLSKCESAKDLRLIVVDSSDETVALPRRYPFDLLHIQTKIKSAAFQRNIGLEELTRTTSKKTDLVAFLDDDVRVKQDYFSLMEIVFSELPEAVGISGVTESIARPKLRIFKKFFGIYGEPGMISRGGVNVPVEISNHSQNYIETNWLIGCSVWKYECIKEIRFENDFQGQSLFEDVIFSYRVSKLGKLYVSKSIEIEHLYSTIGRPDSFSHSFYWIKNRHRLFELYQEDFSLRNYWFANFGKIVFECLVFLKNPKRARMQSIIGIVTGAFEVIRK